MMLRTTPAVMSLCRSSMTARPEADRAVASADPTGWMTGCRAGGSVSPLASAAVNHWAHRGQRERGRAGAPVHRVAVPGSGGEANRFQRPGHRPQQRELVEQDVCPGGVVGAGHHGEAVDEDGAGQLICDGPLEFGYCRVCRKGLRTATATPALVAAQCSVRTSSPAAADVGCTSSTPATSDRSASATASSPPDERPSTATNWAAFLAGINDIGSDGGSLGGGVAARQAPSAQRSSGEIISATLPRRKLRGWSDQCGGRAGGR